MRLASKKSGIHKSLLPTAMYIFNKFNIISLPPYNSLFTFLRTGYTLMVIQNH